MNPVALRELLESVAGGTTDIASAMSALSQLPFENLEFARLDHHRALRCGAPEVIFGQGKTPRQIERIFERLAATGNNVLATRVGKKAAARIVARFPEAVHDTVSRTVALRQQPQAANDDYIAIVAAGTSDLPVAEEARITAELMQQRVRTYYDVGVAGLHRLLAVLDEVRAASVVIAVAGMEGALPSVVGGLVDTPVIAVPTSVGYGASLGGVAALLAMLNSCASGVSVVNIDNGFGAGFQAALIGRLASRAGCRSGPPSGVRNESHAAHVTPPAAGAPV